MPGHSYTQNEGLRELVCRCCVILKTAKLEIVVSILFLAFIEAPNQA
jgi:hypothetical protein